MPDAAGDFVVSRFFEFIEGMTGGLMTLLFFMGIMGWFLLLKSACFSIGNVV